jgi:hypothetical protein
MQVVHIWPESSNYAAHARNADCPKAIGNRTKMFHVKHFGSTSTKILTRPYTAGGLLTSGIAWKIGTLGSWMGGATQCPSLPRSGLATADR